MAKFAVGLLILQGTMAAHEYGHLREMQKRNIPIKEFSINVGPILHTFQTKPYAINLRLIPLMAYVAPTELGNAILEADTPVSGRVIVDTAGVRNNFLICIAFTFGLQILGWYKGNTTISKLFLSMIETPFKIALQFVSLLIHTISFRMIKNIPGLAISTSGIKPVRPVLWLMRWNLILGLVNLMPISPLDGGHTAEVFLGVLAKHIYIPEMPHYLGLVIYVLFLGSIDIADTRIFEFDKPAEEPVPDPEWDVLLDKHIVYTTHLSTRVKKLLISDGIENIEQLKAKRATELTIIHGFGPRAMKEVTDYLDRAYRAG